MKKQAGYTSIEMISGVAILLVVVLGGAGWAMNAYKATQCDFESPYKCEAVRVIGIFVPPVGAIAGYVTIDE